MTAVDPATSAGHVSAKDIAGMPADALAEHMFDLMNASQPNLAAVVLAEAIGKAPTSAAELLRSPEWADDWLHTLIALEGMLRVATARAEIHNERGKARGAWQRARQVSNRIVEARALVDRVRRDARQSENLPPAPVTTIRAARWALAGLHSDEVTSSRRQLLAAAGCAELADRTPSDEEAFFAMAARTGLLIPVDPHAADRTLRRDWHEFVEQVGADVRSNDGIDGALRDPVIVYLWGQALAQIHRETCDLIGIHTDPGEDFPILSLNLTGLDTDTAERKLRQLRYLASVRARWVEQQQLQRDLKHRASQRLHAVLADATNRAIDQIVDQHQPEYGWLLDRMNELADPDTGFMPAGWRGQRKQVLATLIERLQRESLPAAS